MNDLSFLKEIEAKSGEKISACYQCYRCTNSCPVVGDMDLYPHRLIRHIIMGEREKVLRSNTIWSCLQCYTCSVRCPNDIHVGHVFDSLRKVAIREGKAPDRDVWLFDELFMESVKRHGRLHELEAIMRYKAAKKNFFGDAVMGVNMLMKGRMGIMPHNIKDRKGFKEIFKKIEDEKLRG